MAHRKEKLEEQIKRLVGDLIQKDIKDPRIGFVTITGVTLSTDRKIARIGFSVIGSENEWRDTWFGLQSARGYIQQRIGKVLMVRTTPKIVFEADTSIQEGARMVTLLEGLDGVGSEDTDESDDNDNGKYPDSDQS